MPHHLARVNVAWMQARLDSPSLEAMAKHIAEMNRLAEASPGFVWRFRAPDNNLEYLEPLRGYFDSFVPERVFFNLSVWESLAALQQYAYETPHAELFRRRHEWMVTQTQPSLACWWIPAGELPTVAEARRRLDGLRLHGPSADAFNFRRNFPAPESGPRRV